MSATLFLLLACNGEEPDDTAGGLQEFSYGDEVVCEEPVEGFARLFENGMDRGVDIYREADRTAGPCGAPPGGLIVQDLDGDGDPDLLLNDPAGFPHTWVYRDGGFRQPAVDQDVIETYGRAVLAIGAVDLDGDALPEVVVVGEDLVLLAWNLGDLEFADWQVVLDEPDFPRACIPSMGFGDVDGDGDLDLVLPGLDEVPYEGAIMPGDDMWTPTFDRLLINRGGGDFEVFGEFSPAGEAGLSRVSVFTDRDHAGDLDWLASADRGIGRFPPQAFYRNDGDLMLVNDAPELNADLRVSNMGLGVGDLNGDDLFDYCMSDTSWDLTCMMSAPDGGYYTSGPDLGLTVDLEAHPDLPADWQERLDREDYENTVWVSWGIELVDLDGRQDLAVTAGPPPDNGNVYHSNLHGFQPDALWQGVEGGFVERTQELGFGLTKWNYSIASADFDGDGTRELVLGGSEGRLAFWDNPCGEGRWLEVELVGVGENVEGYGTRVEVGGLIEELHNVRAIGQSISRIHFGLGDLEEAPLRVEWPDGTVSEASVPTNRLVTVTHPDRN